MGVVIFDLLGPLVVIKVPSQHKLFDKSQLSSGLGDFIDKFGF